MLFQPISSTYHVISQKLLVISANMLLQILQTIPLPFIWYILHHRRANSSAPIDKMAAHTNEWHFSVNSAVAQQTYCAFCHKSIKFCTEVVQRIVNKFGYGGIAQVHPGDRGGHFSKWPPLKHGICTYHAITQKLIIL